MKTDVIKIRWEGPLPITQVLKKDNGGSKPHYNGNDYGLYQVYGKHILYGKGKEREALLYIGQATKQTFARRFKQHENDWIQYEPAGEGIKVYLGRLNSKKYTPRDKWKTWHRDVNIAEAILIYKYTPCYNSNLKWEFPDVLFNFKSMQLEHSGPKKHLRKFDNAPKDYKKEG